MLSRIIFVLLLASHIGNADALEGLPNLELSKLAGEDQAVRQSATAKTDWNEVKRADTLRRNRVMEIFAEGGIKVAVDYENAALVLLHSLDIKDQRLSHAFATLALNTDAKRHLSRSIAKASWDRIMLLSGQKQWYGTQNFQGKPPKISFPPTID